MLTRSSQIFQLMDINWCEVHHLVNMQSLLVTHQVVYLVGMQRWTHDAINHNLSTPLCQWEWMRNWHTQKQLCSNQLIHWYLMEDQHKQQTPRGNSKDRGAGQCNLYAKSMVKVKRWEQGNKKRCLIQQGLKMVLYSFVINGLLYYGWFIIITVLYPLTLFLFTIHELHDQYLFKL